MSKSHDNYIKGLTMGYRENDNKANQRSTIHVCLELACLVMLLGHFGL